MKNFIGDLLQMQFSIGEVFISGLITAAVVNTIESFRIRRIKRQCYREALDHYRRLIENYIRRRDQDGDN